MEGQLKGSLSKYMKVEVNLTCSENLCIVKGFCNIAKVRPSMTEIKDGGGIKKTISNLI